jgi:hypothetical protein
MIVHRKFNSFAQLSEWFRGTEVATGTAGTNAGGSASLEDLTVGAFAGVQVGDRFYVSEEPSATVFYVDTVTDVNHIVLDTVIAGVNSADGKWRATRGDHDPAAMVHYAVDFVNNQAMVLYELDDFGV